MAMIFEFYEQKYVEFFLFKIKFGSVHQTGKPPVSSHEPLSILSG